MKRFIAIILLFTLGCAALGETTAPGVPGNRMGLAALKALYDGSDNQFVSPVSLAYALSMAAAGAEGETRAELLAALDARDAEEICALNDSLLASGLRWANAVFLDESIALSDDYRTALVDFEAAYFPLDGAERVNAWAAGHTDGLIDHLIDSVPAGTLMMLVNAIVMDQQWAVPFEDSDTWEEDFHGPDGDAPCDFMHRTFKSAEYAEADGTQMLRMRYRDSGLSCLLALPPEGGMDAALTALAERGLDWLSIPGGWRDVRLSMPRLDITVSNSLSDVVKALGVGVAFSENAEFGGMSDQPLWISEILQKVRVEMTEEGTRAAAVTDVMLAAGAAVGFEPALPVEMRLDRPFIVVIADETSGAICFAGVVAKP